MAWISFDRSVPGGAIVQLACADAALIKTVTTKIAIRRIECLLVLQPRLIASPRLPCKIPSDRSPENRLPRAIRLNRYMFPAILPRVRHKGAVLSAWAKQ